MEADGEILSGLLRVWVGPVDYSAPYIFTVTFSASLGHAVLKGAVAPENRTLPDKIAIGRAVFRALKRMGIKTWEWDRKVDYRNTAPELGLPFNPMSLDYQSPFLQT